MESYVCAIYQFEDTPELMIDKYYIIKLELMLHPEDKPVVRTYCGTIDEIGHLIDCLDRDEWSRDYYASTIAAWEAWQEGDKVALHHVGTSVEPLLIPAKEMCRSAYLLDEAQWSYTDKFGCTMLASADTADVHQVLLYRGHFFGLRATSLAVSAAFTRITVGWTIRSTTAVCPV